MKIKMREYRVGEKEGGKIRMVWYRMYAWCIKIVAMHAKSRWDKYNSLAITHRVYDISSIILLRHVVADSTCSRKGRLTLYLYEML